MKRTAIFLFLILTSLAAAQSNNDYRSAAERFARRLGLNATFTTTKTEPRFHRWTGRNADHMVCIDTNTLEVSLWVDYRAGVDPWSSSGGGESAISESEAREIGEAWASRAGIALPAFDKRTEQKDDEVTTHYLFRYEGSIHGYRGYGNSVILTVNALSRRVATMMRTTGYSHDPPVVSITRQQAGEIVQRRFREVYGIDSTLVEVLGPKYSVDGGGQIREESAPDRTGTRSAFLQYVVLLRSGDGEFSGRIDAASGIVIGGDWAKGGAASAVPRTGAKAPKSNLKTDVDSGTIEAAKSNPLPSIAIIVATAVVGSLSIHLWTRSKRKA